MKYYYDLYLSESLVKKRKSIVRKLNQDKFQFNRFVIVLSDKPDEYLEIYNSTVLKQEVYDTKEMFVIGITDCQSEAVQYVADITEQVYKETGDADLRTYIRDKQRQFEEGNV